MDPLQLAFGSTLVVLLLGMSAYFGWRQVQALRALRGQTDLSLEDEKHFRRQAYRRLFGCGLMVLFAALLIGHLTLEPRLRGLIESGQAALDRGERWEPSPEQQQFRKQYGYGLLVALVILMGIFFTAAADLWAIRRYGLRHHRQIQADRREMIAREIAHYRSQRNGHH